MTAEQVTDAVVDRLANRLVPSVAKITEGITADVQRRIDVPVGRDGGRIIRSKPDEPPRREFGDYQKSWRTTPAIRSGDEITSTSGTSSRIGVFLERGTERMEARPHVGPAAQDARGNVIEQLKQNL